MIYEIQVVGEGEARVERSRYGENLWHLTQKRRHRPTAYYDQKGRAMPWKAWVALARAILANEEALPGRSRSEAGRA